MLGYAKFINRQYGEVLYRGECKLHPTLMPSLLRDTEHTEKLFKELNAIVSETMDAESMKNFLKVDEIHDEEEKRSYVEKVKRSIVEGMLQHYGIPTRFIDLVDNHWVALWMCLNSCVTYSLGKDSFGKRTVCKYQSRYRNLYDIILSQDKLDDDKDDNLYGFLLLVCLPSDESGKRTFGVSESTDFIRIDLRQALPSAFLRPHAQHGIVARKVVKNGSRSVDYDMATQVVGIIKIRIDRINEWLGKGELLTQSSLFPSQAYDDGYNRLLANEDLFLRHHRSITRYV